VTINFFYVSFFGKGKKQKAIKTSKWLI